MNTRHPNEQETNVPQIHSFKHQLLPFDGTALSELETYLFAELRHVLKGQQPELALKRVVIDILRVVPETRNQWAGKEQYPPGMVSVRVTGVTIAALKTTLENHVDSLRGKAFTLGSGRSGLNGPRTPCRPGSQ